jgi:acyl-coenzyme A thioesterase 13
MEPFSAWATEWVGGLSIASQGPRFTGERPGTHVNCLRIEGRANAVGKTLALTTVTMSKKTETDLDEHP